MLLVTCIEIGADYKKLGDLRKIGDVTVLGVRVVVARGYEDGCTTLAVCLL